MLTRHALAASNRDGTASSDAPGEGLTDAGREQARRLGEDLAREAFDLGIASELRRTQETLDLALGERDVPRLVVPELNEIHFGSFAGGLLTKYRIWAAAEPPELPAPGGGESRAQAAARFALGLRTLARAPGAPAARGRARARDPVCPRRVPRARPRAADGADRPRRAAPPDRRGRHRGGGACSRSGATLRGSAIPLRRVERETEPAESPRMTRLLRHAVLVGVLICVLAGRVRRGLRRRERHDGYAASRST